MVDMLQTLYYKVSRELFYYLFLFIGDEENVS